MVDVMHHVLLASTIAVPHATVAAGPAPTPVTGATGATTATTTGTGAAATGGNTYSLPVSQPVNPSNTVLGKLMITALNWVLGVLGFGAIALGMYRFIQLLIDQYRGKGKQTYEAGFVKQPNNMPSTLHAAIDILVGIVIAGMFLSGTWVTLVDGLLHVGGHIATTIGNQLSSNP